MKQKLFWLAVLLGAAPAIAEQTNELTLASVISEVERGKTEPSISTLKRLAAALGTSITYFFTTASQANGHVIRAAARKQASFTPATDGHDQRSSIKAQGVHFEVASPDTSEVLEAIYGRYVRVEHWANALNGGPAAARSSRSPVTRRRRRRWRRAGGTSRGPSRSDPGCRAARPLRPDPCSRAAVRGCRGR